jgi:hypothetical protein
MTPAEQIAESAEQRARAAAIESQLPFGPFGPSVAIVPPANVGPKVIELRPAPGLSLVNDKNGDPINVGDKVFVRFADIEYEVTGFQVIAEMVLKNGQRSPVPSRLNPEWCEVIKR